jgi:predicted 3-demethylubiquinone-9 3-methyltransferase (glyoxalase superfamily)
MQKIVPHLWFDKNIAEAANFYASTLPNTQVVNRFNNPDTGEDVTAEIDIDGYRIALINGGPYATPTPAISFFLNFDPATSYDAESDLRRVWEALSHDGSVLMNLGEYPFSSLYGWVADRFGFNWQLMLTSADQAPRPFVVPSLMYCGPAQGKATEAVDGYIRLFDDSALGNRVTYDAMGAAADKNSPESVPQPSDVAYSDFQLAGQWFSAMDSGVAQPFTFTPGVSLMVLVKDQDELDRYWDALTSDPDKEQCGWLEDKYGISWQIAPENLSELLARPQGFDNMLKMKKLIIDDF